MDLSLKGADEEVKTHIHLQCPLNGTATHFMFTVYLVALIFIIIKFYPTADSETQTEQLITGTVKTIIQLVAIIVIIVGNSYQCRMIASLCRKATPNFQFVSKKNLPLKYECQ